jgi:hypothetical protein
MSRGPGHIERTIATLIERTHASHQQLHFDVLDIAAAAYPEKGLTKAQEVAVRRAMHSFARKHPRYVVTDSKCGLGRIALIPWHRRTQYRRGR